MEARQMTTRLIKDGKAQADSWHLIASDATAETLTTLDGQDVIVPLHLWQSEAALIRSRRGQTGVWLDSNQQPTALLGTDPLTPEQPLDIQSIPVIALNFPEFKDGRAFSHARELRQRMKYSGEIRAIGDVLRDQLFFMRRCGFNAYVLRADQDMETALQAFQDFHDAYQPAVDQPLPLFRRRQ